MVILGASDAKRRKCFRDTRVEAQGLFDSRISGNFQLSVGPQESQPEVGQFPPGLLLQGG